MIPAGDYALLKAKALPDTEAFAETGNLRTGPQGVSNRELVKAWAEEFLKKRNLVKAPIDQRLDIAPEERVIGAKLLDKYLPATTK
jgi:hypothetical protein